MIKPTLNRELKPGHDVYAFRVILFWMCGNNWSPLRKLIMNDLQDRDPETQMSDSTTHI